MKFMHEIVGCTVVFTKYTGKFIKVRKPRNTQVQLYFPVKTHAMRIDETLADSPEIYSWHAG